jgi:hypothetical protein
LLFNFQQRGNWFIKNTGKNFNLKGRERESKEMRELTVRALEIL